MDHAARIAITGASHGVDLELARQPTARGDTVIAACRTATPELEATADNQSGGNYGYRMSKTAVNMAGVNLAHDLKPLGITVVLLHPGYVRTELARYNGFIDPPESVAGLIARLDAATLEETGTFWHAEGYQLPW